MTLDINLQGLSRDTLLIVAERACARLVAIANQLTTDEGDEGDTEEEFGLSCAEVVSMALDGMIADARSALDAIGKTIADERA